jgi:hypothetical protein
VSVVLVACVDLGRKSGLPFARLILRFKSGLKIVGVIKSSKSGLIIGSMFSCVILLLVWLAFWLANHFILPLFLLRRVIKERCHQLWRHLTGAVSVGVVVDICVGHECIFSVCLLVAVVQ